ncbi:MAG: tetratricopeptide repeat protein [Ruminococcaceae bacterium]|nr:tetratricopeptide repeat protein [Oscillospiraceae bacterium]
MFCKKCGKSINENDSFCSFCGERVVIVNQQTHKKFTNKCESCGAVCKQFTPSHFVCEYCGSEYHLSNDNEISNTKITEIEILKVFRKAAEFEVREKYWEELQCLLEITDRAHDNSTFWVKLGRAYRRNSLHSEAIRCYEEAKRVNPNNAAIFTNIGAVYIVTKQYDVAEPICKTAVEMMNKNRLAYTNDDYAVAHSNLAIAIGMQGRKEEAKQCLKIAEINGYKNGNTVRKMIGIKKGLFF